MAGGSDSLWLVVPAGETASGGWIDDTLRERAREKDLLRRTPLAGQFPRQRVEAIAGPDASDGLALSTPYRRGALASLRSTAQPSKSARPTSLAVGTLGNVSKRCCEKARIVFT